MIGFLTLSWASPAAAEIPEYFSEFITQGSFDRVANAFLRVGLIASDEAYRWCILGVALLLVVGSAFSALKWQLLDGRDTYPWLNWIGSIAVGLTIYAAFVLNTSTFLVRDQTNNKFVTVTGIPDGIAFLALFGNKIEQGIVNIIETSATPSEYGDSYLNNPGGITFDAIAKVFNSGVDLSGIPGVDADGSLNNANLQTYIRDCFFFELSSPNARVTIENVDVNSDFVALLAQGSNPALPTVYHSNAEPAGETVTCDESWSRINQYLAALTDTSSPVMRFYSERCGESGFAERVVGATGPDMVVQCQRKISGYVSNHILGGATISAGALMRQYLVASEIHNVLLKESPDTAARYLANRATGSRLVTTGMVAGEWMPVIKSMAYGVFLGISPFLLMLAATPLYGRAVAVLFGLTVFFIAWGVSEALVHQFARDAALDVMKSIANGELGLKSMLMFSTEASRAFACFAPYQLLGFILAGTFAGALTRFGGSAINRLAMGHIQTMNSEASKTAETVFDPAGTAKALEAEASAMPTMSMHNQYRFRGIGAHRYLEAGTRHATAQGVLDQFGGRRKSVDTRTGAELNTIQQSVAANEAVDREGARTGLGEMGAHRRAANYNVGAEHRMLDKLESDMGSTLDTAIAAGQGRALNVEQAYVRSLEISEKGGMPFMSDLAEFELGAKKATMDELNRTFGSRRDAAIASGQAQAFSAKQGYAQNLASGERGDMDFIHDTARHNFGRTAGAMEEGRAQGLGPAESGEALGAQTTADTLIGSRIRGDLGDRVYESGRRAGAYDNITEAFENRLVSDVGKTGKQSAGLADNIRNARAVDENLAGAMGHMRIKVTPQPGAEAENWANYLSRQTGTHVSPGDIAGSAISVPMSPGSDGFMRTESFDVVGGERTAMRFDQKEYTGGSNVALSLWYADVLNRAGMSEMASRMFDPNVGYRDRMETIMWFN